VVTGLVQVANALSDSVPTGIQTQFEAAPPVALGADSSPASALSNASAAQEFVLPSVSVGGEVIASAGLTGPLADPLT